MIHDELEIKVLGTVGIHHIMEVEVDGHVTVEVSCWVTVKSVIPKLARGSRD